MIPVPQMKKQAPGGHGPSSSRKGRSDSQGPMLKLTLTKQEEAWAFAE